MKERSARRAAPREGERSQVAEVLNICIVDPSTIWRHTAREILCRELDANGVRACVDEFYAPESMTSDGGCAYYDVVLADISDRQTREQYLRFFRDLRLTSPQTKLILLSADPLAALDVFECDPDYFVCKLEMETRLSAALRFVLRGGTALPDRGLARDAPCAVHARDPVLRARAAPDEDRHDDAHRDVLGKAQRDL